PRSLTIGTFSKEAVPCILTWASEVSPPSGLKKPKPPSRKLTLATVNAFEKVFGVGKLKPDPVTAERGTGSENVPFGCQIGMPGSVPPPVEAAVRRRSLAFTTNSAAPGEVLTVNSEEPGSVGTALMSAKKFSVPAGV